MTLDVTRIARSKTSVLISCFLVRLRNEGAKMNTTLNAGNQCPICHQTAHVRHVAALYEEAAYHNDPRFSPPTKLAEHRFLLVPITLGIIVETVTLIAVMLTCVTGHFSFGQYWLSVAGIGLPLILSVMPLVK